MAITLTSKALWQLTGFTLPDGDVETQKAEAFTGIGFFARPPSSGKPEAIVIMVNDAQNPVVIAVRDEKTRAAIVGALEQDESAIFNTRALVVIKADGTIEARSASGVAGLLATKADLAALKAAITGAATVANDGGAAFKANILAALGAAWPVGTTKLKGE
ncbi:MAG: hypothetical protein H0U52_06820 [Chloroflexi bacterium]|nr:hypothetical protein [Chloroflexota bacterium]